MIDGGYSMKTRNILTIVLTTAVIAGCSFNNQPTTSPATDKSVVESSIDNNSYGFPEIQNNYEKYDQTAISEIIGARVPVSGKQEFGEISAFSYYSSTEGADVFHGAHFYVFDSNESAEEGYKYICENWLTDTYETGDNYTVGPEDACDVFLTSTVVISKNMVIVTDYSIIGAWFSSEQEAKEEHERAESYKDYYEARKNFFVENFPR